jgi:peroxiredoxin
MKKIVLALAFLAIAISCNKLAENEFEIDGTIDGVENGIFVILEKQDEMGNFIPMDTTKLDNGKFSFKGESKEVGFHYIQIQTVNGKIPFILENGTIKIEAYKDSIQKSKITGTYSNEQYLAHTKITDGINVRMKKFQDENTPKWMAAQAASDTVTMNALMKENKKFEEEYMTAAKNHIKNHPNSFLSAVFIDQMLNLPGQDIKEIEKSYNTLSEPLKKSKPGVSAKTKIDELSKKPSVEVGSMAPDFSAPNPEGTVVSLKESLGKVTIIDFWASWCGPCRKENPNVVALYDEFHSKGLNIIGVSLDKPEAKEGWIQAIAADKLTWPQVSNLKHWEEPIAKMYGVQSIPATFILDASGKIVARDLRGAELKAKVQELLGS